MKNQDTKQEFVFSSAAAMTPHPDKVHSCCDTSSPSQEVQILSVEYSTAFFAATINCGN